MNAEADSLVNNPVHASTNNNNFTQQKAEVLLANNAPEQFPYCLKSTLEHLKAVEASVTIMTPFPQFARESAASIEVPTLKALSSVVPLSPHQTFTQKHASLSKSNRISFINNVKTIFATLQDCTIETFDGDVSQRQQQLFKLRRSNDIHEDVDVIEEENQILIDFFENIKTGATVIDLSCTNICFACISNMLFFLQ